MATHGEHLQYSILSMVARVLRPTLTLGDPDILFLLVDGVVDITAHELRGSKRLAERKTATHDKGFVHAYQSFDPRIDEQVVADSDLDGGGIALIHEHDIEESGVEHNVTVVADERKALTLIRRQARIIERAAVGVLADDMLHDGFHEPLLEVERGPHPHEETSEQTVTHRLGQPGRETFHHDIELSVVKQVVERQLHLFRLIRPYLVELCHTN